MIFTELLTSPTALAGGWFLPLPLFWLLLIGGIAFLLLRGRGAGPSLTGGRRETGIDVLERRFAEGELSLEEYRERRSVLEEKQ
jgi:putative membrane protein